LVARERKKERFDASGVYTYDSNGNRLSYAGTSIIAALTTRRIGCCNMAQQHNYTANGELLTKTIGAQTTNYQYDALGNLITVTLPNSTQIVYVVDGQNRRVGKKVDGVSTQGFLYESQLRPVAELDGVGNVVSRFVYATRINVPDYMIKGV
jgi:YD repeat-containing protein